LTNPEEKAGANTRAEILSEPNTWKRCFTALDEADELGHFRRLDRPGGEWVFVGCGSSFYLAQVAASSWSLLTGETARALPASEILLFPDLLPRRCRSILISRSGRTSEVIEVGQFLIERDERALLAVTCGTGTPIEQVAEHVIRLPDADEKSTVMTRSFTSMLLTLQLVAANRAGASEFASGIRVLPYEMKSRIGQIEAKIRDVVRSQTFEDYVFLGQGPFYGIADESMLKIKEMSCSYAQSFHTLEFRHGPKAIVGPKALTTFLMSDSGFDSEVSVLTEVKELGGVTLVITNHAIEAVRKAADFLIELSLPVPEAARAAAALVPGQLLGLHTGVQKGLDPDNPRHLSRVVMLDRV
jgi:glucosamine--fructose-6-phosphate aminotransferase (isomerizing)